MKESAVAGTKAEQRRNLQGDWLSIDGLGLAVQFEHACRGVDVFAA